MEYLNFYDCLDLCEKDGKPDLFLGNGFSISCRSHIFTYKQLFDQANFEDCKVDLKQLFHDLFTTDFEYVIHTLQNTKLVLQNIKGDHKELTSYIYNDSEKLKNILCDVISNTHPNDQSELTKSEIKSCRFFLSHFKRYFTINYDLLIYWVLMAKEKDNLDLHITDGFYKYKHFEPLSWTQSKAEYVKQNLFYIHGALHLHESGLHLLKSQWTTSPIIEQIKSNIKNNIYPVLVTDGSYSKKLEKILRIEYLKYCYNSLSNIDKNLFIFGFSFSENDLHITNKIILNSKIKNIYISIKENDPKKINYFKRICEYINQHREKHIQINFKYYLAEEAEIWTLKK